MLCVDRFEQTYKRTPDGVAFCPYRICPVGAHIDHQLGKVTGFAIDKGIHIAYGAKANGVVELSSVQFEKRAQFHVKDVPENAQGDWADYLRGITQILGRKYPLRVGLSGVIEGTLPIGGLSSSAAVMLAFLSALCDVNGITLSEHEMIMTAMTAENKYVGVSCGKLDPSSEVLAKKDNLLVFDPKDDSFELFPASPTMKPYKIAIFFSGIERNLAGTKFNMRVDECRSAAYALKAYAGMEYGKFEQSYLRDIPYDVYTELAHRLPESWKRRADHFFSECTRVEKAVEAWKNGDIETFGRMSFESGASSISNYETGSPELKTLYEILTRTEGVYGGRFSGAGFKGCCMALIDPSFEESIIRKVSDGYLKEFPLLEGKYSYHLCQSASGVGQREVKI